jgi:hypothetical protein
VKFVLATPRILLAEEVEADNAEDAIEQLRDSGGFAQGMTEIMRGGDFDTSVGSSGDFPTKTYVINVETKQVVIFEMALEWKIIEPETVHLP